MQPGLPFRFRPPWWAAALAAAGCAAGIALGNWQSGRADEKRAAAAALRTVALHGEFVAGATALLENRFRHGRAGYEVLQPLRLAEGGRHVLVLRGWIAALEPEERLPVIRTPTGPLDLKGVRLEHLPRVFALEHAQRAANVWQNATVEDIARWSGIALEPWVLEQRSALDDGLARDQPQAGTGAEVHESYALQWYSLAVLSVLLFFGLNLKIEKRNS